MCANKFTHELEKATATTSAPRGYFWGARMMNRLGQGGRGAALALGTATLVVVFPDRGGRDVGLGREVVCTSFAYFLAALRSVLLTNPTRR